MQRFSLFLLLAAIALSGCSNGPKTAKVHGKVTVDGVKTVPGATVVFQTEQTSARGTVAEDGSYTLMTLNPGDGAPIGKCKVTVHHPRPKDSSQPEQKGLFAEKYESREKTPLQFEVKPGDNTFDIPLTSK